MCALSTVLTNELTTVLIRGSESGTKREVSALEIIADYNQFMGGVDLADQFICYYSVGRSGGEKWFGDCMIMLFVMHMLFTKQIIQHHSLNPLQTTSSD